MRIVIDVGGTKTLILAVDKGGKELTRRRFPTDEQYNIYKKHLCEELHSLCKEVAQPLEGIAIALPGVVDQETKVVEAFGNLQWKNIDLAHLLEAEFSVPLVIDNDANFGAIGEARSGAGKGYRVVLYVTISTGIGTGVAVDGKISPALARSEGGAMHFRDGDKYVQWEKVASGKAFYLTYKRFGKETPASETEIWKEYAEKVALGLEELIAVIQPDVIVIGGSMGEHLPKYQKFVEEVLHQLDLPVTEVPPIKAAKNPDEAVIRGGIEAINDVLSG